MEPNQCFQLVTPQTQKQTKWSVRTKRRLNRIWEAVTRHTDRSTFFIHQSLAYSHFEFFKMRKNFKGADVDCTRMVLPNEIHPHALVGLLLYVYGEMALIEQILRQDPVYAVEVGRAAVYLGCSDDTSPILRSVQKCLLGKIDTLQVFDQWGEGTMLYSLYDFLIH
jgi:hypothetical protein